MSTISLLLELKELQIFIEKKQGKLTVKGERSTLTTELKARLTENRDNIIQLFDEIGIDSNNQIAPTTYAQQRLWFVDQLQGSSIHYNMPGQIALSGEVNLPALTKSLNTILERHESLRTFYYQEEGQSYQIISEHQTSDLTVIDLCHLSPQVKEAEISALIDREASTGFVLSRDTMLRMTLLVVDEEQSILLYTMHHIASDGWSMGILVNEFGVLYNAYSSGKDNPLPPLAIQYADYAHWQRKWLQGEVLMKQLGYWEKKLHGLPKVHNLPLDHQRSQTQSNIGRVVISEINKVRLDAFEKYCRSQGATLFMGLYALFSVLLGRYSGDSDIVIGTAIANREQPDVAPLVGFFINTLVLRTDLSSANHFDDLVKQCKQTSLQAYAHQQVPFEQLVQKLDIEHSLSYSPIFQLMLILQNNDKGSAELADLKTNGVNSDFNFAKFELTLDITESEEGLFLGWNYFADLFEQATIERMATSFDILFDAVLKTSQVPLTQLAILSDADKQHYLGEAVESVIEYDQLCIHALFEQEAIAKPDAIAVIFEDRQLTYAQLNKKANQLAHYLINVSQLKTGEYVGICVERSIDMIIGILGIMKAGGAYVPLDSEYPKARLDYMVNDTKLNLIITQSHLKAKFELSEQQLLSVDNSDFQQILSKQAISNIAPRDIDLTAKNSAYVIYTSGSTGQPKGVIISHQNWTSYQSAIREIYELTAIDRILQISSISFDIFIEELTASLFSGGTLVIPTTERVISCNQFWQWLEQYNISVATLSTALWHQLCLDPNLAAHQNEKALRLVITGGEVMSASHLKIWQQLVAPTIKVFNTYGPTESTVIATYFNATEYDTSSKTVPIGIATSNSCLMILDKNLQLIPQGVVGELFIGGKGVATGYLDLAQMTIENFIQNPFSNIVGDKYYKTGDLVRYLPDGNIEFIGRVDDQVKLRGFRIELREIEKQIGQCDNVIDNIAIVIEDESEQKRLVSYIKVEANNNDIDDKERMKTIREALQKSLPFYMIPSAFVVIDQWPLTPNGKIDKKSLPVPISDLSQSEYLAAETAIESALLEIWGTLLNLAPDQISTQADFFVLGGHSLLVIRLNSLIHTKFSIDFPIKELFIHSTTKQQAEFIELFLVSQLGSEVDDEYLVETF